MSALLNALRRKYKTPREAVRALGLDESLLEGRAGPHLTIGDSKPEDHTMIKAVLTRKAAVAQGALLAYLYPKLAQDAKINLTPALAEVTRKNFKAKMPGIISAVKDATRGKLAQDATLDDLNLLLDKLDKDEPEEGVDIDPNSGLPLKELPKKDDDGEDEDPMEKVHEMLRGKGMSEDEIKAIDEMIGDRRGARDEESEEDRKKREEEERRAKDAKDRAAKDTEEKVTKKAMDSAINSAVKIAQDEMRKNQRDVREAEELSAQYVGKLAIAYDSAETVYRETLTALGVDVGTVKDANVLKIILKSQPLPNAAPRGATHVAMDSASVGSFYELYPAAKTHTVQAL